MGTPGKYYIVDSAVLPEIFSKVVEVKELLATGEARTINEPGRSASAGAPFISIRTRCGRSTICSADAS